MATVRSTIWARVAEETVKAIYDSAWHHPFVAYLVGLWLVFAIARQLPFLYGYLFVFVVCILADATATGGWSPVPMGTPAYTFFSVLFIILGDMRYFVLAERVSRLDESLGRTLRFSIPLSFAIPVVSEIMRQTLPFMRNDRVLYVVYEGAMCVLVLLLERLRFGPRVTDPALRRYLREVSWLFAGLYFGWALCDVLILLDVELAHLLRIVPNVLYYAAFLVVVFVRAPASLKTPSWPVVARR
jgi:hypothetical protein